MVSKILLSTLVSVSLCTGLVYADKPDHAGKGKKEKHQKKNKKSKQNKNFSSHDVHAISSYYKGLPPGLQKKVKSGKGLPPGWQKKVTVGQPLPYDFVIYAQPVPYELSSQLTSGPIGTKLLQLADRVVRIEVGTNMILEAIDF